MTPRYHFHFLGSGPHPVANVIKDEIVGLQDYIGRITTMISNFNFL